MCMKTRRIELLAPARNLATGITAVDNGADAVYIGAMQFGARQAAGNSVDDIRQLVEYAHIFGVKVYVTLNTIIYDSEIADVESLVAKLYEIGVDALIVQDTALLSMNIPPIPLHASTQMDNRTASKVKFLSDVGFQRVVLARELSLQQIADIHQAVPDTELEVFVHGALCVSYSGQCYASQHCFGRSANRGECAQFCRLAFDMVDADGNTICRNKHLLSLKDMNRSAHLEEMLDAGVTSLKIEGRLKDESYVKNVTAYYRMLLDDIFERRRCYVRASYGRCTPQFSPQPEKSFNRGFTNYFLLGERGDITSFDTPKSKGESMGCVRVVSRNFFTLTGDKEFANGDGACFIGRDGNLYGFRINKVEGGRIFPQVMPSELSSGDKVFRNYDMAYERMLSRPDVPRRLLLNMEFCDTECGFSLSAVDETGLKAEIETDFKKDVARTAQRENIITQLKKLGNTCYEAANINVNLTQEWFVPSSLLSDMRRRLCDSLSEKRSVSHKRDVQHWQHTSHTYPLSNLDYRGNVANVYANKFYMQHGVTAVEQAYELKQVDNVPLMFCKHCIKYSMGWCSKSGKHSPYREPFYLVAGDGCRFRLFFDCKECMMTVTAENKE